MIRRKSKQVKVKDIIIGGDSPISVQSMTNSETKNVSETVAQIQALAEHGCDLVRATVDTVQAAEALPLILKEIPIPLVADIHFDYRLALKAVEAGVHKVRINPGNIGSADKVKMVLRACQERGVPIRIGVNAGSLEADILQKNGYPTAQGMVESALRHIRICEENNFDNIIISLKSSHVDMMIDANRKLAQLVDYPLHLGVTEAGTLFTSSIYSAVGIGTLLAEGIGDTLRVSITKDRIAENSEKGNANKYNALIDEIRVGRKILKSLGLQSSGVTIVSCPTCGRIEVNIVKIVNELEKVLADVQKPVRLAVMGCVVNGPGESKGADLGLACGKGFADFYRNGEKICRVSETEMVPLILQEVEKL